LQLVHRVELFDKEAHGIIDHDVEIDQVLFQPNQMPSLEFFLVWCYSPSNVASTDA